MRWGKFPLAILALGLSGAAYAGDVSKPLGALMDAAMACSRGALVRYAASTESAAAIADASFEICGAAWTAAATFGARERRASGDPTQAEIDYSLSGFKAGYLKRMTALVFELRATSPAPKKAPAGRDY